MTKKSTFITQYNRTPESVYGQTVQFKEPSKVKESLSYATDINTIYENYCKTGKVPLNGNQPIYDENFVKYDSLVEAQRVISEASTYFNTLPTEIRAKYGNSLEAFVRGINSGDSYLFDKGVLVKKQLKPTPVESEISPAEPSVQPATPAVSETTPVADATTV